MLFRIILFATGQGSDPSHFRPQRDTSQWWNRNDALVRCCTAAAVFANVNNKYNEDDSYEVVVVFDDDSFFILQLPLISCQPTEPPTEQDLLHLWKKCSRQPGILFTAKSNWTCRLTTKYVVESSKNMDDLKNMSKRHVLAKLQSQCSIDFLRAHHLNSSADVLLRKTNKEALLKIWEIWKNSEKKQAQTDTYNPHQDKPPVSSSSRQKSNLENILRDLLRPPETTCSKSSPFPLSSLDVIAGVLHESSEHELSIWCSKKSAFSTKDTTTQSSALKTTRLVCFFLGAVRDMHSFELDCLQRVCSASMTPIPLVRMRLGSVPEFTSKIISILGFHHDQKRLLPAMQQLAAKTYSKAAKSLSEHRSVSNMNKTQPISLTSLRFVLFVPITSNRISTDLKDRNDWILWSLVRCTVNCLWRSRLVGNKNKNDSATMLSSQSKSSVSSSNNDSSVLLKNTLTVVFQDNIVLDLDETMVTSMAEQHQAAPSEYQILSALQAKLTGADPIFATNDKSITDSVQSYKKLADLLVQSWLMMPVSKKSAIRLQYCLMLSINCSNNRKEEKNLAQIFYSTLAAMPEMFSVNTCDSKSLSAVVILPPLFSDENKDQIQSAFADSFLKSNTPVLFGSSLFTRDSNSNKSKYTTNAVDYHKIAASIAVIQHFYYHGCLSHMLQTVCSDADISNRKRKRKQKS